MAYAIDTYTGNASTTSYSITFPYIEQAHVIVTLDGVTKTLTTDYSFSNASTIAFVTAPASAAIIKFTRSTSRTSRLVDYQDGSTITEAILDQDGNQSFYLAQEAIDITEGTLNLSASTDQWDAISKKITNVADPTLAQDAVSKNYLESTWLSTSDKANITTLAGISALGTLASNSANVTTVAGAITNVNTVATADTNVGLVATNIASVNTVATNIVKVVAVADDLAEAVSEVITVADDLNEATSEIDTVATNIANVNTVGTAIANVNLVGGSITNVNTVATNIASVNNFADQYRIASSAPVSSLDVGDLYFDTTANELKVYKSSGWAAAGSTVNGTSARYNYTATAAQTTFTGSDTAGNTLAYDAGFADVYLNGVRLSAADITITSGTSVVLATGAAVGDILDIVAYGTFSVASIAASAITSGTIGVDRIPSITNAKLAGSITEDKLSGSISNAKLSNSAITINGSAVSLGGSVTVGETKPTISSISPSTIENTASNVVITGTNFGSSGVPNVEIINSNGVISYPNTITRNSATQLTINVTIATDASYFLRIELEDGNAVRSSTAILTVSDAPVISTVAGSLGSFGKGEVIAVTVAGTGDATLVWSSTGTLPTGLSLNTSTGVISGTESSSITQATTYSNIQVTLTDGQSQATTKTFSITITVYTGSTGGGQFN